MTKRRMKPLTISKYGMFYFELFVLYATGQLNNTNYTSYNRDYCNL